MYTIERKVWFSDCGPDGILRDSNIINYFQDCSTAQSEELGVGVAYTKAHGKAWILSSWQICINRRPALGGKVKVHTWPSAFKGIYGYRNFTMESESGELLAYANSIWVYMDVLRGRPCRPSQEEIDAYGEEPPFPMENAPRKIAVPEGGKVLPSLRVGRIHLDWNGHMNNGKYIEMAMENMPVDYKPSQIRVDYRKEALYGAVIVPKLAEEEGKRIVELCDEEGAIYATIEFTGEESVCN